MRNFKRLIAWTIIAVLIECGGFIFLEKVYFSTDLDVKFEKAQNTVKDKVKEPEITFDEGIENLMFSSDGKYGAYLENGQLKTISTKDKSEKILNSNDGTIEFYKWLDNDSSLIVIKKVFENGAHYYKPVAFDAKKGEEKELSDFDFKSVKIKAAGSQGISDVAFSTATHSIYIKVKKGPTTSDLYYANVMNELKLVKQNRKIGTVVVPITNTNAVYEQLGAIHILNNKYATQVPGVNNPVILGTDDNANVYFGNEVNGKIKKIVYKDFSSNETEWKNYTLDNFVDKKDIYIDYSGKIYINNESTSSALELTTGKTIKYKGKLLQSYSAGLISLDDNKLVKNKLND